MQKRGYHTDFTHSNCFFSEVLVKVLLFANTEWYLYNFRSSLAHELVKRGYEVLLVAPPGTYRKNLEAMGFRVISAPMRRRSLNLFREMYLVFWLCCLLYREKVDIVHSFTIKCVIYGSLAGRLVSVSARISAVPGLGYIFTGNSLKARVMRGPIRWLLRVCIGGPGSRLILQNVDDVAMFENAGLFKKENIRLIPGSGVDTDRFQSVSINKRTPGSPMKVLLAARLLWDKGIREYVNAARILHTEGRSIRFLLAGTPDLGNPASIDETFLRNWVEEGVLEWLGHVEDMPALLSEIDVAVLPSHREGLPKSLIEAAACALPLVTTDVPGCREVVSDGKDGLLIPVGDAPALADAVRKLHDDPAQATELGLAARKKALELYDERVIVALTLGVYDELLPSDRVVSGG